MQPFLCVGYCAKVNLQEEQNHQTKKSNTALHQERLHTSFLTLCTHQHLGKNKLGRTAAGSHIVLPRTWSDWLLNKTPSFLGFVSFIMTQHALNHGIGSAFAGWNPELRHSIYFFCMPYLHSFPTLSELQGELSVFLPRACYNRVGYCKCGATKGWHWVQLKLV